MENKGLIFIPDISGFTRFINETEISHSRLIIQELLEILINANQIGLEISEIEGDAILFYRFGDSPSLEEIYRQVQKMFCEFHKSLVLYDNRRFCQCKACRSVINLTLKVVTHYGEFTGYTIKNFNKLIGRDIIVAHQLLKNDIPQHEYWLVTNYLLHDDQPAGFEQWMKWSSSSKQTESGEIPFYYTQLTQLKKEIRPDELPSPEFSKKTKIISVSNEYETGIIELFHAAGDLNYRSQWQEGVKKVEEINHFLPRVGTRCRCILDNGQTVIYASSYNYHADKIEFSETEEKTGNLTYYALEKISDKKTKLTIDYYIPKNIFTLIGYVSGKKNKLQRNLQKSLENLQKVALSIKLPA